MWAKATWGTYTHYTTSELEEVKYTQDKAVVSLLK